MLARRVPTILPELNLEEALEATKIHSVAGYSKNCLLYTSPSPRDRTRSRMPSSA